MQKVLRELEEKYKKSSVVDVRSGDTVRVHQRIKEGDKTRVQVFEGLVIKTRRKNSVTSAITVRRISSGVGVERTFKLHSPLIEKIEVTKRSDVNRNYLSYMRKRSGKSARLASVEADFEAINKVDEAIEELAEQKAKEADEEAGDAKKSDSKEPVETEAKQDAEEEKPAEDKKAEAKEDIAEADKPEEK